MDTDTTRACGHTDEQHDDMIKEVFQKFADNDHDFEQLAPRLNIVQLNYIILQALEYQLSDVEVFQEYNNTIYTMPVSYTQRANIRIEVVDRIMCDVCDNEVLQPAYKQTVHTKCKKDDN